MIERCTCEQTDYIACPVHGAAHIHDKLETILPGRTAQHTMPIDAGAVSDYPHQEVSFAAEQEPMAIYRFDDGSVLKVKLVLMHVERIEGAYNPDGTPMYNLAWQQALTIVPSLAMKRKP